MHEVSDAVLLAMYFKHGCEESFRAIVARYDGLAHAAAARILGPGPDAEDAAQAAFVALALKGRGLDASRGLGAWLHKVTVRAARDIQKSSIRRKTREEESVRLESLHGQDGTAEIVDDAIGRLPEKMRRAIVGHYLEGRSIEEIASAENCSASAISMRLTRSRERLKNRLGAGAAAVLAGLAASQVSQASTEATLAAVRILALARSTTGTPLIEIARNALRPTWREISRPLLAGASAAAIVISAALATGATAGTNRTVTLPPAVAGTGTNAPKPAAPSRAAATQEHPLIAAIKKNPPWNDSAPFTSVLKNYVAEINSARDADGLSALHWTIQLNAEDFAALLLQRGADANSQDAAGRSALIYALERRSTWLILLLILRGADIDRPDKNGKTPLAYAAATNDLHHAEILLWAGANPKTAGAATGDMAALLQAYSNPGMPVASGPASGLPEFVKNPLHLAAKRGDFPLLEKLLVEGPGVNARDEKGQTPLHEAILGAQPEVVFYLLMMGADPNALDNQQQSPLGKTMGLLGGARHANRLFLFAKGANPNTLRADGHNELTWAAFRNNDQGVQWLLWLGVDPFQRTKHGTAMDIAVREGNQRIIDMLRRAGVEGNPRQSNDPSWLLQQGAKLGDMKMLDEALNAGATVDQPDGNGNSPLMLSIIKGNVQAARYLLKKGARSDFVNAKNGWTPLFQTVPWDFQEMNDFRKELLERGADSDVRSKDGITPLMRATWNEPSNPLRQLIEYGADLNARDPQGRTALGRALKDGHLKTADFLRLQGATE